MAQALPQGFDSLLKGFNRLSNARKIGLLASLSGLIAIVVVAVLWARTPEYRVLYSNLSEHDGGDVVAALAQMNIAYQFSESGTAILVPALQVYDTRLRLASQGLPKGGSVGYELMENQKFGISQFAEQVNYQRALAGELARTIQALGAVQSARVHLAIPRPSVFTREQLAPSASVFVSVHPGRTLDGAQVVAIQHLVAGSVPELTPRGVTVVDQAGNLLSANSAANQARGLDASQLQHVHQVEQSYVARIENILKPLLGNDNLRAQVAATLDFSEMEQTAEVFAPNSSAAEQATRSQQTVDTNSVTPGASAGGVPGALSNQPPGSATAPLNAPNAQTGSAAGQATSSVHRESTVNFEVGKTITHTRREAGLLKRMSVAVVVNYRKTVDKEGKSVAKPLSSQEMAQIDMLVREAMGFSKERGDSLNVVNAAFAPEGPEAPLLPLWERPEMIARGIEVGKVLLAAIALLLAARMIRGAMRDLQAAGAPPEADDARTEPTLGQGDGEGTRSGERAGVALGGAGGPPMDPAQVAYEADLAAVRALAKENPRMVANIIRDWVTKNE